MECLAAVSQLCSARKKQTRLYIIRHGETVWNAERRIQGQLDIDLNEVGKVQAENTADALSRLGVLGRAAAVVSSDLLRASRTADIIAAASPRKLHRAMDAGFREINFGKLQGSSSDCPDSKALQTANINAWLEGDLSKGYPEGEDGCSLMSRSLSALRNAAKLGEVVIVVAHGGMIRWTAAQIESGEAPLRKGVPFSDYAATLVKQPVVNCCCSTVIYDHDSDSFHPEAWFADLQSVSQVNTVKAKDDSG
ncbi:unnamed protein product [Symbiodinium necroappetens]|uniref:Uncharacterized protein n=1 Tax=Symbiodinium necroappetens TaxID=1628268 RepID=A0A813A2T8_9DINO|nr:unnamed protein product [Symbiodinium necroappetens]